MDEITKHTERFLKGAQDGTFDLYLTHKTFEKGYQTIQAGYGDIPLFSLNNEKDKPVITIDYDAYKFIETNTEREEIYAQANTPFSLPTIFEEAFSEITKLFKCNSFEIEVPKSISKDPVKGPLVDELIQNMEAGFKNYKDSFGQYEQGNITLTA